MILRRLALFVALLFAFLATQLPEYVQQYRQGLRNTIDELSSIVARFDSDARQQNLTGTQGIDRLRKSSDRFVRQRGDQEEAIVARLHALSEAQDQFRASGPIGQLATFATHLDTRIASSTFSEFKPAVPVSPEAFVLGLVGFVFGGGVVHMAGRPLRRRLRRDRDAPTVA